ncbi:hypothetical protein JCM8097_005858 [Rhodosporidiobolus ruineniae]
MADQPPPPQLPKADAPQAVPGPSTRTLPPKPPKPTNPFVYLGIPQFVLDWRPSVPGPKMSVFLALSAALTGAYVYDRKETHRILQDYVDQVRWMSEQTIETSEQPRRVKVYAARVPEDGEMERSSKWFKRYMRPILVASGTDYTLTTGTAAGGLGRTLQHEIRARRITEAAQAQPGTVLLSNSPQANVNAVLAERDLEAQKTEARDGAIVLLGRSALKEYLWALRKGWGTPIDLREEAKLEGLGLGANERRKDGRWEREEEIQLRELEAEDEKKPEGGPFDERATTEALESAKSTVEDADAPAPSGPVNFLAPAYSSSFRPVPSSPAPAPAAPKQEAEEPLLLPPQDVPAQPPLLLVPFSHPVGIRTWPAKLLHFFNHRSDARIGGEAALALVLSSRGQNTRPLDPPKNRVPETGELAGLLDDSFVASIRRGENHTAAMEDGVPTGSRDLDFLAATDERPEHFKKSYRTLPKDQEYYRRQYYVDELPGKLKTARELARAEREPSKAEVNYPPKIESELRKERLDKELRWRRELEGWGVQRAGSGVAWREEWSDGRFRVVEGAEEEARRQLEEGKKAWGEQQKRRDEEREREFEARDRLRNLADDDE